MTIPGWDEFVDKLPPHVNVSEMLIRPTTDVGPL